MQQRQGDKLSPCLPRERELTEREPDPNKGANNRSAEAGKARKEERQREEQGRRERGAQQGRRGRKKEQEEESSRQQDGVCQGVSLSFDGSPICGLWVAPC